MTAPFRNTTAPMPPWPHEAATSWIEVRAAVDTDQRLRPAENTHTTHNASSVQSFEEAGARERHRTARAATPPAIPGYELRGIIGRGAFGEVWLARAETGEYRAIKVVWREDFKRPELYEQEFEGSRLYQPLSHDNYGLVPIFQVERHGNEYFFCVMELADDTHARPVSVPEEYCPRTLHNAMSRYGRRPIPLDQVLGTGLHLAYGLARLHEEGLTHGDIKPSNIVYIQGQPRLADAGLVSPAGKHPVSGTEGYIPPEGPGSRQADVYALAMVLYEMATGRDRYDFPTLPAGLPEGNERWLAFNRVICEAADPAPARRRIHSAMQLGRRLEALRHPPVFPAAPERRRVSTTFLLCIGVALLGAVLALIFLLPEDFPERLHHAWEVLMGHQHR